MKKILIYILFFPKCVFAQIEDFQTERQNISEMKWVTELTWNAIKAKAKIENKYIFVDCYATWCLPCIKMQKDVLTNDSVSSILKDKFISIKLQMDTSQMDDNEIKEWYPFADSLKRLYSINSYPSFLFFSPEGEIVHKDIGYKNPTAFLEVLNNATDSNFQYYTLRKNCLNGVISYEKMGYLALIEKNLGDKKFANLIAIDYKYNYLDLLQDSILYAKKNFEFWRLFPKLVNSKDCFFTFCYWNCDTVDRIMSQKGWCKDVINSVIVREEIYDHLWVDKQFLDYPNWERIRKTIWEKYNSFYSEELILSSQIDFYRRLNKWEEFTEIIETILMRNRPKKGGNQFSKAIGGIALLGDDSWGLNVVAWDLFLHCNTRYLLKKAFSWINIAIKIDTLGDIQLLDTKANLLYKLGKRRRAISEENNAIKVGIRKAHKDGKEKGYFYDEFNENLNKMKRGEPTWN